MMLIRRANALYALSAVRFTPKRVITALRVRFVGKVLQFPEAASNLMLGSRRCLTSTKLG